MAEMTEQLSKSKQQVAAGRTVTPAVSLPLRGQLPRGEVAKEYLSKAGWTLVSENDDGSVTYWADPMGRGPEASKLQPTLTLPGRDNMEPVVVQQVVCPPAPWNYSLSEAVAIQRERDRAVEAKAQARAAQEGIAG